MDFLKYAFLFLALGFFCACAKRATLRLDESQHFKKVFEESFSPVDLDIYFDAASQIIVTNRVYSLAEVDNTNTFTEVFQYQTALDSILLKEKVDFKVEEINGERIDEIKQRVRLTEDNILVMRYIDKNYHLQKKGLKNSKNTFFVSEIGLKDSLGGSSHLIMQFFKNRRDEVLVKCTVKGKSRIKKLGVFKPSIYDYVNLFVGMADITGDGIEEICLFKALPIGVFGTVNLEVYRINTSHISLD